MFREPRLVTGVYVGLVLSKEKLFRSPELNALKVLRSAKEAVFPIAESLTSTGTGGRVNRASGAGVASTSPQPRVGPRLNERGGVSETW